MQSRTAYLFPHTLPKTVFPFMFPWWPVRFPELKDNFNNVPKVCFIVISWQLSKIMTIFSLLHAAMNLFSIMLSLIKRGGKIGVCASK